MVVAAPAVGAAAASRRGGDNSPLTTKSRGSIGRRRMRFERREHLKSGLGDEFWVHIQKLKCFKKGRLSVPTVVLLAEESLSVERSRLRRRRPARRRVGAAVVARSDAAGEAAKGAQHQ